MTVSDLIDLLVKIPANSEIYLDTEKPILCERIMVQPLKDEDEIVGYCLTEDTEPEQLNLPLGEPDANNE